MKRFYALALAAVMTLSLAACGSRKDTSAPADPSPPADASDSSSTKTACEPLTIKMYNAVAGQTIDAP